LSVAPTVSAAVAAPGLPTDASPLLFPAAMTNSAPVSALSASTAWSAGSLPSLARPSPRLRLITFAPFRAAHSIPAITWDIAPWPELFRTLPIISEAAGATPLNLPSEAAPEPATIEATCVPCPLPSTTEVSLVKLALLTIRPWKSGWDVSMPVSRTATFTPWPWNPLNQAVGAPIWMTLTSSEACTVLSSETRSIPRPSVRAPGPPARMAAHNCGAWPRWTRTGAPLMLFKAEPDRAPGRAPESVGAAVPRR
jgi:hypothetical protein